MFFDFSLDSCAQSITDQILERYDQETKEWIDSLSSILETDGSKRAQFLIKQLIEHLVL